VPSAFCDIEGGISGLYRMLHPLVAAGFVGMFRGALYFMLPIEISAARTIRSACMTLVPLWKTISPLYVEHTESHGDKLFAAACQLGLEGIVSKKLNAPYKSGPSKVWLKIKNPNAPAATR
jgi:hypothetical protein